jgi:hypothetical protein
LLTTAFAVVVAGAAFAEPTKHPSSQREAEGQAQDYRDMQLGIQDEGLRQEIVRRLEADADRARKDGSRYGGVLYRIDVYRDELTGQVVQGHPTLVNVHGYGATSEAALIQGDDARSYLPEPPKGPTVIFEAESSGYVFTPVNASQPLRYFKILGADAKALRQKADALRRAANPKSMAGLVGSAGLSVPLTNASTRLDVLTRPEPSEAQLASQQRRSEAQAAQAQQVAEQVKLYRQDQQHEDGDAAERFEHEARARNEHGDSGDDTEPDKSSAPVKDKDTPKKDGAKTGGGRNNRSGGDRKDKGSKSESVGTTPRA